MFVHHVDRLSIGEHGPDSLNVEIGELAYGLVIGGIRGRTSKEFRTNTGRTRSRSSENEPWRASAPQRSGNRQITTELVAVYTPALHC